MSIRRVTWQQTLDLRSRVLRPGLPLQESQFEFDDHPETIHYGAFDGGSMVGVATFFSEKFPEISARKPYRLRGMAVDPKLRRSGIGRSLIEHAEQELISQSVDLIWFNAREVAFDFYAALGYQFCGPLFDIPGIGPHKVMWKTF